MHKFTSSILAMALATSVYSVTAIAADDNSSYGTSETPQAQQQKSSSEKAMKKSTEKKERMSKKAYSKKYSDENASSMNNKPIGTTNGVSHNGSTDDTKMDKPINGTTTGTNNENLTKVN